MDEPFRLENRPIYVKPATVKPPPEKQGVLFRGLGDSPGQVDLFNDLERKDDDADLQTL